MSKFKIIRDTREKPGHGWNFRATQYCEGQELKALPTGDYSIEGREEEFCIERKASTAEIAKNFLEKRFWNEIERLQTFKHAYIIFEFSLDDVINFPRGSGIPKAAQRKMRISSNFLLAKIAELQVKYGIHVIFAGDSQQAQRMALCIIKKVHNS